MHVHVPIMIANMECLPGENFAIWFYIVVLKTSVSFLFKREQMPSAKIQKGEGGGQIQYNHITA